MLPLVLLTSALLSLAAAQHHDDTPEVHPKLRTWKCTKRGGCIPKNTAVVLDSLKRPLYQVGHPELSCGKQGAPPNTTACPDADTCQKNCVMEGIQDYSTVGVTTQGDSLYLDMLRDDDLAKISPRVYLLSENQKSYEMIKLTGNELRFDVDVSKLPCGMNGALYFSEMEKKGGRNELNKAGPVYGTGYCDAQCYIPPFLNGEGNIEGYGACCNELDVWEANSQSTHLAPHTCNITSLYKCEGAECSRDGVCDKPGCAYNPYNVGNHEYYGHNMIVDTTQPFTVVTQFLADQDGKLDSMHRLYVQNNKIIQNAAVNVSSLPGVNYLDDEFCEASGATAYTRLGGTAGIGDAMSRGMVLCMSVWWDESGSNMAWLDSGRTGRCTATEGSPAWIRANQPDTSVKFSNIRWGEIGSTFKIKH
ncbi:Fc.00g105370.m01.CDS01 [Cosmosporella sp. VM-42]